MLLEPISLFILGLVFGSFISALTWRYAKGISIVKGRSICPNCKQKIDWYDNIPLLSFIFLLGKCRHCKKSISWRYPLIEAVAALGFLFIGYQIFWLILFCILEIIFVIDLENQIIPDEFIFVGILVALFLTGPSLFVNIPVGFVSASILMVIHLVTRGRGMGLGDVKFAVLGGILVGPKLFLVWLFLAFLTGAVVGSILIIAKKAKLKSRIAFGPFLVVAIPLAFYYGEKILTWLHFN